ncbi:hexapeptide transferase family protein [Erythrobacter sp. NAP1]|uniref:acyltransferase n=1 Tax=Erythrobacter sp. NAP1 TaxID=237727 RepID=UPI0000686CC8|nr:acyltransferase [Erythrobacter sp. NAP1]EAQ30554.1 hexapeptide transferase family protein [Erythrobacter sp. NAP1]
MLIAIRKRLYLAFAAIRRQYLRSVWGMDIGKGVLISGKAFLDYTHPKGIHIGDHTIITPGARIFAHDFVGAHHDDTRIGKCCFIGANVVVTAGVTIGDHCVIAAGSIVNGHVPDRSMVAGNPARIVKTGINTGHHGRMVAWAEGRIDEPAQTLHGTTAPKPLNGPQHTQTSD